MAAAEVVGGPSRLDRELRDAGGIELEGDGKAGPLVALAVAAGDAVDRQHHDVHTRLLGARHHLAVEGPVFMEVELIDLRPRAEPPGFLQAGGAERGHAEHGAVLARRRRDCTLAVMMEQALERGR